MTNSHKPRDDDATPKSEHSPPPDRGGRSRKIGVTVGYAAAYFGVLIYFMGRNNDWLVLAVFLLGLLIFVPTYLVVWHPEQIKYLRLQAKLGKRKVMKFLAHFKFWEAVESTSADAVLEATQQASALAKCQSEEATNQSKGGRSKKNLLGGPKGNRRKR